jgi:hypothetical protein
MAADIYQTPQADLQREQDRVAEFYVVSRFKFIILYTVTLGLYGAYWFYQHWSLHKSALGTRIWPLPRTIFSIFYAHSLFRLIYRKAVEADQSRPWRPNVYATIYVIFDLFWVFSEALTSFGVSTATAIAIDLISMFAIGWVFLEAQIYANIACADVTGKSNSHITFANYIWILLGMLLWVSYAIVIMIEAGLLVDFG